jgi:dolichyl-phosphate beta-glucosyltransferase
MPSLSVVIPAYNEARRIEPTLQRVLAYLQARGEPYEVLVVDDGSTDATPHIAQRYAAQGVRVLSHGGNRGKGYSVRQGMLEAGYERVLFSDADLSTPIETLDRFLQFPEDVIIASRDMPGAHPRPGQPWYRWLLGQAFRGLVHGVVLRGFRDTQCGFKLFTRQAARAVFSKQTVDRFAFDVEALAIAVGCGFRVREVAVDWANHPETKVRLWRDGPKMILDLLAIARRRRRGKYRCRDG